MKNEEKIVELLSEQIKRQDNQEILQKKVVNAVNNLTDVVRDKF